MKYEIIVELKDEVLDTQGRAIFQTLTRLGHQELKSIKVSKRFVLELEGAEYLADSVVESLAQQHLANTVSEIFTVKRL